MNDKKGMWIVHEGQCIKLGVVDGSAIFLANKPGSQGWNIDGKIFEANSEALKLLREHAINRAFVNILFENGDDMMQGEFEIGSLEGNEKVVMNSSGEVTVNHTLTIEHRSH